MNTLKSSARSTLEKKSENTPDVVLLKAKTAIHLGKYEQAMQMLKKYKEQQTYDFWTFYLEGVCALRNNEVRYAKVSFRKAIELSKVSIKPYFFYTSQLLESERQN